MYVLLASSATMTIVWIGCEHDSRDSSCSTGVSLRFSADGTGGDAADPGAGGDPRKRDGRSVETRLDMAAAVLVVLVVVVRGVSRGPVAVSGPDLEPLLALRHWTVFDASIGLLDMRSEGPCEFDVTLGKSV